MSIQLTLTRLKALLAHPSLSKYPYTRPTVHVAGTNGKGSVCAFLDSILSSCDSSDGSRKLRVGRFNSPHLVEVRDSICIGGDMVEKPIYDGVMEKVTKANEDLKVEDRASSFEVLTAVAMGIFEGMPVSSHSYEPVDIAILECGMGGVSDATNVIPDSSVVASVITSVSLDHQAFLGSTVEEIALNKAGIIRNGANIVSGKQEYGSVKGVVESVAERMAVRVLNPLEVRLQGSDHDWEAYLPNLDLQLRSHQPLPLAGSFQADNLGIALSVIDNLPPKFTRGLTAEGVTAAVQKTRWPGRLEHMVLNFNLPSQKKQKLHLLLDGAHNASSSAALASYIASLPQSGRRRLILSLSHSPPKTPLSVLSPLLRRGDYVDLCPFTTPEGMPWVQPVPMQEMIDVVEALVGNDGVITVKKNVEEALIGIAEMHWDGMVVVSGSLYLVADALRYKQQLEENRS